MVLTTLASCPLHLEGCCIMGRAEILGHWSPQRAQVWCLRAWESLPQSWHRAFLRTKVLRICVLFSQMEFGICAKCNLLVYNRLSFFRATILLDSYFIQYMHINNAKTHTPKKKEKKRKEEMRPLKAQKLDTKRQKCLPYTMTRGGEGGRVAVKKQKNRVIQQPTL